MPTFRYRAISADGQSVTGEVTADDVKSAIEQVLSTHRKVLSIQEVSSPAQRDASAPGAEEGLLREQIGRMVEQRAVIVPAWEAYAAELPAGGRRTEVQAMAHQLQQPHAAEELCQSLTPQWARVVCASFRNLSPAYLIRTLDRRYQSLEGTHDTLARVLVYPAVVLCACFVFLGLFAYLVAPVFRDVFDSLGFELPWLTAFVLRSAEWITSIAWYWYLLVALFVAAVFWRTCRSGRRCRADRIAVIVTFAESLADLLDAKVDIPAALRLAGRTAESPRFRDSAEQVAWHVETGSTAIQVTDLPHSLIHAVTRIEEPAAAANLLRELAMIFRVTRNRRIHWVLALLEPLAIVCVGLMVGLVFFATFLPLFSLISNLS